MLASAAGEKADLALVAALRSTAPRPAPGPRLCPVMPDADHAGTERDMLLLDRYGDDIDGGSGDMKKMKKQNFLEDSSDDEGMPDGLSMMMTKSKEKKKRPKSSSVCSRLRPLREIAHRSEMTATARVVAPPPHSSSPHRRSEHGPAGSVVPPRLFRTLPTLPTLPCPLFPAYSSAP